MFIYCQNHCGCPNSHKLVEREEEEGKNEQDDQTEKSIDYNIVKNWLFFMKPSKIGSDRFY
jgi:hypothetical protein